jgi:hypothetical protein
VRFVPNGRNTTSSKRSIKATRYGQLGQALAYVYFEEAQGGPDKRLTRNAARNDAAFPGVNNCRALTAGHPLARTGEKVVAKGK